MSRILKLVYTTSNEKNFMQYVNEPKDNLDGDAVTAVMNAVVAANVFAGKGNAVLTGAQSASVVTTEVTELF